MFTIYKDEVIKSLVSAILLRQYRQYCFLFSVQELRGTNAGIFVAISGAKNPAFWWYFLCMLCRCDVVEKEMRKYRSRKMRKAKSLPPRPKQQNSVLMFHFNYFNWDSCELCAAHVTCGNGKLLAVLSFSLRSWFMTSGPCLGKGRFR